MVLEVSISEVVDLPALTSPTAQVSTPSVLDELPENKQKILAFLKQLREDRVSANKGLEIITSNISSLFDTVSSIQNATLSAQPSVLNIKTGPQKDMLTTFAETETATDSAQGH